MTFNNLADAWLHGIWQATEGTARNYGHRDLFHWSRSLAGYQEAEASWRRAWVKFIHGHGFRRLKSLSESSPDAVRELFFLQVRLFPAEALRRNDMLILNAACNGDVEFFKRIAAELRDAKLAAKKNPFGFYILAHWLASCLWLASDAVALTYLERATELPLFKGKEGDAVNTYAQTRRRLGLCGYESAHKHPFIIGCTKKPAFIFSKAKEWTKLASSLSR